MADMEGRCVGCGFLGKHDRRRETNQRYPGTYEVEWLERAEPNKARHGVQPFANAAMPTELICYRGAAFIADEIGDTDSNDAALKVIWADRKCKLWCKYIPGLDPKEHLMERRLDVLEQDRRDFQRALSKQGRWIAIVALLLAFGQVMNMTAESVLYKLVARLYQWGVGVVLTYRLR